MGITIEAVYEAGMLKPLEPLPELREHSRVRVTIEPQEAASSKPVGNVPDHNLVALLERMDRRRIEIFQRGGELEDSAALIREGREKELE